MLPSSMVLIQSTQKPFPLPDGALQEIITFGRLTLETYFFENVNGQPTDGFWMPNHCHINTSLESGELTRQLRRQGEPHPTIFLC